MKDYFKVEEGQEINSLQDLYLTYTTIMIHLIDTYTYESMMVKVVKDILENDEIVAIAKKLRRKDRMFLGKIIYPWATDNWKNFPSQLPQSVYSLTSWGGRKLEYSPYRVFLERFEEAFHAEVLERVEYDYESSYLDFEITEKDNTYNIKMYKNSNRYHYDNFGRMIVKYNEANNTLKIGYIENIIYNSKYSLMKPQNYRLELFRKVRIIMNRIEETIGEEPKVICHKKYNDLLTEAIERGYLKKKKKKIDDMF